MEIKNGVYLVDGVRGANCYLYVNDEGILVIDTGMPGNAQKVLTQVKALSKTKNDIKLIILTHSDIDHSGSAAELRKITGAKIAMHGDEKELKKVKGVLGVVFKVMLIFMRFEPVKPDVVLKDGDVIGGLKIVYTPGHTKGSICLYKAGEILFAGDALRIDGKGNPILPSNMMNLNSEEAFESAKKIAQLEFDILLPGHGIPIKDGASLKVKKLIESR